MRNQNQQVIPDKDLALRAEVDRTSFEAAEAWAKAERMWREAERRWAERTGR